MIKNPVANAGDIRDTSSIPGSGRSPGDPVIAAGGDKGRREPNDTPSGKECRRQCFRARSAFQGSLTAFDHSTSNCCGQQPESVFRASLREAVKTSSLCGARTASFSPGLLSQGRQEAELCRVSQTSLLPPLTSTFPGPSPFPSALHGSTFRKRGASLHCPDPNPSLHRYSRTRR